MIYLVSALIATAIILAGRCLYLTLVCDQLRTVNEGHVERLFWSRYEDHDQCDGSGI